MSKVKSSRQNLDSSFSDNRIGLWHDPGGQVEPLTLAVPEGREADPVEGGRLVAHEVEDECGRRAFQEVQPAVAAGPLQEKAGTRDPGKRVRGS